MLMPMRSEAEAPPAAILILSLPDALLAAILHEACRPVPWPWSTDACGICRHVHRVCMSSRHRGWFLQHSTLGR